MDPEISLPCTQEPITGSFPGPRASRYLVRGFDTFTAVKIHVEVFWVITPCDVAVGVISQKTST